MDCSSLRTLALSTLAFFTLPRLICADDPPVVTKAKGILRGLLDERDKLVRGVCRVKGKKFAHGGTNPDVDGETTSLIAFDFSKGLYRYDNDEPAYRGFIGAGDFKKSGKATFDEFLKTVPQNLVTMKLRYIKNENYVAVWFSNSGKDTNNIQLFTPDESHLDEHLSYCHHPFDIRACGMLDYAQFSSGGWPAGARVADYCEFIKRHKITDVGNTGLGKEI